MKNLLLLAMASFVCGFIFCLALIWCGVGEKLTFREMMDALMQNRRKDG